MKNVLKRWFEAILRFLNLLEEGKLILSISKVGMWASVLVMVHVGYFRPDATPDQVYAGMGQLFLMTSNYAWRRKVKSDGGKISGGG